MDAVSYTEKEMKDILNGIGFPKGLKLSETFTVFIWAITNNKKLHTFCHNIKRGMSIHFAFKNIKHGCS